MSQPNGGLVASDRGVFWQPCWSARSVVVVEVNGYTIEPGADLTRAKLGRTNLSGADLQGADLKGADLSSASLPKADLSWTDFHWLEDTGAFADEDTVWPEGFDPKAAGVIFD